MNRYVLSGQNGQSGQSVAQPVAEVIREEPENVSFQKVELFNVMEKVWKRENATLTSVLTGQTGQNGASAPSLVVEVRGRS